MEPDISIHVTTGTDFDAAARDSALYQHSVTLEPKATYTVAILVDDTLVRTASVDIDIDGDGNVTAVR